MNENYKKYIEIAVVIGVVYLIYILFKKAKNLFTDFSGEKEETEQLQSQIDVDKNKLQYPEWQYKTWANSLKVALLGDIDEDEDVVNNILYQINSDNDMAQLIKDFGVVNSTPFGVPIGHNYDLVSAINNLTPELVSGFNWHYENFQMKFRF